MAMTRHQPRPLGSSTATDGEDDDKEQSDKGTAATGKGMTRPKQNGGGSGGDESRMTSH
jgi:hypothetical protein